MKLLLVILSIACFSLLTANSDIVEMKTEKKLETITQEVAFKKELELKKQRQESLKREIEKLKEALLKEQNKG